MAKVCMLLLPAKVPFGAESRQVPLPFNNSPPSPKDTTMTPERLRKASVWLLALLLVPEDSWLLLLRLHCREC